FTPRQPPPATAPADSVARGAYLVNSVSLCGDCHTPQNADGSPNMAQLLAGNYSPDTGLVPNITPDNDTGIGKWTVDQIATLLRTGKKPDGKMVTGLMALQLQGGYNQMTVADATAIGQYLKTIPPVKNTPQAPPQQLPVTGEMENGTIAMAGGLLALCAGAAIVLIAGSRRRSPRL
ncbi:MAG: hypothetical protein HY326_11525, partial [Chloroflexi bacterium]|nr:hypothetical protein [Chloroflexota bacterium]